MKIGVLGTGMVGQAIATKLAQLGHGVMMGSRTKNNSAAVNWAKKHRSSNGTFEDAAAFGEMVFNCTSGAHSLEALRTAGAKNLEGKILVDIANPLDFSKGMPPTLTVCNTDSLGEQIQREFPAARVIKTLNTVNANIMTNPSAVPGSHDVFISGDDAKAKAKVVEILKDGFGWKSVIDLGPISTARGVEMYLILWVMIWNVIKAPNFNLKIVK